MSLFHPLINQEEDVVHSQFESNNFNTDWLGVYSAGASVALLFGARLSATVTKRHFQDSFRTDGAKKTHHTCFFKIHF